MKSRTFPQNTGKVGEFEPLTVAENFISQNVVLAKYITLIHLNILIKSLMIEIITIKLYKETYLSI